MSNIRYKLVCVAFLLTSWSCQKNDGPSIDDQFLNYEIEEIPVTDDYNVGALYYSFGTFNTNIKELPVVGKYSTPNGQISPDIMQKHIEMAKQGGIDYFVFQLRSISRENANFKSDSALTSHFVDANSAQDLKFAIAYNFSDAIYAINTTNPIEGDATKRQQFVNDIKAFVPYFKLDSYMRVNGKAILYMLNAQRIYSNDNPAVYKAVRDALSESGIELYIIGMQERWSPPARYPFRFKNAVDAVVHQSFVSGLNSYDRFYLLPQMIDQNWEYSRKYFKDNLNVDYVPDISPAYSPLITNPASTNPVVGRNDGGALYRKICNVAKMNASNETRLILIDSWNKWDEDLQLEPAESYGNLYLDITKDEFKK